MILDVDMSLTSARAVTKTGILCLLIFASELGQCSNGFTDDFASGDAAWRPGPAWNIIRGPNNNPAYHANYSGDTFTWNTNLLWDVSWTIEYDLSFQDEYDPIAG